MSLTIRTFTAFLLLIAMASAMPAIAGDSGYPEELVDLGITQHPDAKLQAVSFPAGTVAVCYLTSSTDVDELIEYYEDQLSSSGWTIKHSVEDYRGWLIAASGHLHNITITLMDADESTIEISLREAL